MIPSQIKEAVKIFSKFPGVGERTATRFALYLLSLPKNELEIICENILSLKTKVKICHSCFSPFCAKGGKEICEICDSTRKEKTLCIVERETDFWQIEKAKRHRGYYFILGGKLEFLKENTLGKMRIEELKKRIKELKPKEIILALNPTAEGILTMDYLNRILQHFAAGELNQTLKINRLGQGLPMGGEIEYTDEETLKSAFEGRK